MAVYVPRARRRRRILLLTVAAFVLGALLGGFAGRVTAPTPAEQVAAVQEQARQVTAQLRVLSLHADAGAVSLGTGDAGTGLALHRSADSLDRALAQAPWIPPATGDDLRARVQNLATAPAAAASTASFAGDVDRLAGDIDTAFGLTRRR